VGGGVGVSGVGADGTSRIVITKGGGVVGNNVVGAAILDPFRDRFWPKSVASFLILAAVMTFLSVQFVSPTRRWRPSLPGRRTRTRSA
jgi:hypothetical protein